MTGILNIDKPSGITSGGAVAAARKILGERTVGHMGTLDPMGTGVLILGVGKAARLFDFFMNKSKTYEAEFCFGYETDTLDKDGAIQKSGGAVPSRGAIEAAAKKFVGKIMQTPPRYSAKNIGGRRAYDLARRGEDFELKPARIEIYAVDVLSQTDENTYKFRVECSSGTYIRSLCRDIAYAAGTLATMTSIRRTRCGDFSVGSSVPLDALSPDSLIPLSEIFKDAARLDLDIGLYKTLKNGVKIPLAPQKTEPFAVWCGGELWGLGRVSDGYLRLNPYLYG
ncbi:MAG: tRNA pseudouridine(55) synthase TruB [Clostridiales bacterium]|jgi:tRNA pseudouridine55 synthase|nr:tRNA pseudouridine(55) synthase TruB [Clostridiales bacterium]